MAPQCVLMLGSGFVTKPTLDVLSDAGVEVTVACRTLSSAKKLSEGVKYATPISLDVLDSEALYTAIAQHDLVISLIPYTFHATVIKAAVRAKKNVVTTSYISPAMLELEQDVKDAGILVFNEIGLDPGIDSGNPLGYKFSWSSRGVLLALRNAASFYEGGKITNVAGLDLMATAQPYYIYPGFAFVAYPNRDSTPYKARYDIPEAETIVRGTLRYQGFPEFIKVLVEIGFLSDDEQAFLKESISWKQATQKILGASSSSEEDLLQAISSKSTFKDDEEKARLMTGLKWVGIFSDAKITPKGNPLDTLCATLEEKMQFEEGERDLVLLQHKFEIEKKDGSRETITSTLCEYGAPVGSGGYSAMAKLVGIPCAVATLQILRGELNEVGILAPMSPKINDPLMKELKEKYGIECKEKIIAQ